MKRSDDFVIMGSSTANGRISALLIGLAVYHSETQGRAVAVHIAAVLEALETIYGAGELKKQIGR